jgi:IclR family transcriptional regulator, pca regulon regulatory protein
MVANVANVAIGGRREVMGGLAKGLEVLRTFSRTKPNMTLSEIAARAGLPAATARRCLNTFEELGYVARHGRQFLLRPKVLEIGAVYLESMDIESLTRTHLEEMAGITGDSASLSVLSGTQIVYVARTSVRTLVRLEAHVGSHFPAHATSMGRVLLSGLPASQLQHYFEHAQLEQLTDKTVVDRQQLEKLLDACRRDKYSVVEEELALGVVALAVPVYATNGRIVAALNSSSHARQANGPILVKERLPLLQRISAAISTELARIPGLALSTAI